MRGILAALIVVVAVGGSRVQAAPVETGKVFSGPEGEQVAVIPLTPLESNKAILLVQGTDSEFDGKVLPYDIEKTGEDVRYVTQWHGRRYVTFYLMASGGRRKYYLNVPGRRDDTVVNYDDARTLALKPEVVYAQHQKQMADGSLTRLMAFDRKGEEAKAEAGLADSAKSFNAVCGTSLKPSVDWKSVSDDALKQLSIPSYCGAPYEALQKLCASPEGKKAVQAQIKDISCHFGEGLKAELRDGQLNWTTFKDGSNQEEFATKYFMDNLQSAHGQGEKLSERLRLEKIRACTDGKGHYVIIQPHEERGVQLAYGDGKRFVQVDLPPWVLTGYNFLEPRFYNKTMNHSFRGLDMGLYSEVTVSDDKQTCSLRCGETNIPLSWVTADQVQQLLSKASFEPNPQKFEPYALLRDSQGRYYLVERGHQKGEERNFRVSIGPKGNLQPQKMKDVVSDSKGEIFSTTKGELRLLVDREAPSAWIENQKRLELRSVPIEENMPLIYNELGVYTGARLGTPCDDQ